MRPLLLLDVFEGAVVASRWQRGAETVIGQHAYAGPSDLSTSISALLATVPTRGRRERVRVRLDFPFAQVKRIQRVPPTSAHVATRIVRANQDAFFMRSRGEQAIPDVWRDADGAFWAAAFDRSVADEIAAVLRANGRRIERFEPSRELLPQSGRDGSSPFAWRPPMPAAALRVRQRVERSITAVLMMLAIVGVIFAPALRAREERALLADDLRRSGTVRVEAARARAELTGITTSLNTIESFDAQRRALTSLFTAIGTALPESTAITTLHIDSTEASFVAMSPHVVDVLGAVSDALPGRDLRIASVVVREQLGAVRVERATFRARRQRESHAAPTPVRNTAVR